MIEGYNGWSDNIIYGLAQQTRSYIPLQLFTQTHSSQDSSEMIYALPKPIIKK